MPDILSELILIEHALSGEIVRDAVVSAMKKINKSGVFNIDEEPSAESQQPVKSGGIYDAIQEAAKQVDHVNVTLSGSWSGSNPYYKYLTISGITGNTKVDILPNSSLITQMKNDGIKAIWIQNNNSILTAYTFGAAPTTTISFECELSEGVI